MEIYNDLNSIQIQPHHWEGEHKLSMEGAALDYFKNDNVLEILTHHMNFINTLVKTAPSMHVTLMNTYQM